MRIGFDVSQTGQFKTGCGYFADALVRELALAAPEHTFILFPTFGAGYWDHDWAHSTLQLPERANVTRARGQRRLDLLEDFWLDPPLDQEAQLGWPDVVHSNNFFCPTNLRRARLVYTLHDLAFIDHPEWTTEANWRVCFEGVFHASQYADRVIAVSEFTRRRFLETFPYFAEERISVVYEASRFSTAPDRAPARLAHLRPGQFWLASGDTGARKNLAPLIQAHARLTATGETTLPMVVFGSSAQTASPGVQALGYLDDASLSWLYANCFAFCYPSLYEGFGLPVVEAMSLGAPVLTSNATSLPEVVGESALLIDPGDPEALCAAMRRLAREPGLRQQLGAAARTRAAKFSWRIAAAQVLDVYRAVTTEYPRSSAA